MLSFSLSLSRTTHTTLSFPSLPLTLSLQSNQTPFSNFHSRSTHLSDPCHFLSSIAPPPLDHFLSLESSSLCRCPYSISWMSIDDSPVRWVRHSGWDSVIFTYSYCFTVTVLWNPALELLCLRKCNYGWIYLFSSSILCRWIKQWEGLLNE